MDIASAQVDETTDTDDAVDICCVGRGVAVGSGEFVGTVVSEGMDGCSGSPELSTQQTMSLLRTEHPRSPSDWFVGFDRHRACDVHVPLFWLTHAGIGVGVFVADDVGVAVGCAGSFGENAAEETDTRTDWSGWLQYWSNSYAIRSYVPGVCPGFILNSNRVVAPSDSNIRESAAHWLFCASEHPMLGMFFPDVGTVQISRPSRSISDGVLNEYAHVLAANVVDVVFRRDAFAPKKIPAVMTMTAINVSVDAISPREDFIRALLRHILPEK